MSLFFRARERRRLDLEEEIRTHFELAVKDRMARGESRKEAERAARLEFGSVDNAKEDARAVWGGMWVDRLERDFRIAFRGLTKRPGFSLTIIVTLALGIGINVGLFSLVENTLLRPLPVPEPDRLVNFADPGARNVGRVNGYPAFPRPSESGEMESVFSYGMFRDLEREQESFVGLAGHRIFNPILSTGQGGQHATGFLVSGGYFSVLGLQPALGRLLGPQDDQVEGFADSVVLSYSYWQSNFEGDPEVLGQTLFVDDAPLTIVGVAPEGFRGTVLGSSFVPVSVFAPISMDSGNPFDQRHFYWVHLFGRLKPGVSLEAASVAMNSQFRGILSEIEAPQLLEVSEREREAFRSRPLVLEPGSRGQTGGKVLSIVNNQLPLLIALGSVVLLLCCANVGGLFLLRSTTRSGEMAVRASLGASRGRVASLLLTESLVLALPAGLLSLAVALLLLRSTNMLSILPDARISWISEAVSGVNLSTSVALVAIGVAMLSAVIFGLFPLLRLIPSEPATALRTDGAKQTKSKGVARFRALLATTQIALSMTLLAMTAALAYSLSNIARLDLGIDIDSVAMVSFDLPSGRSLDSADLTRIEEELGAIPGVTSVAASSRPLFSGPQYPAVIPATVEGAEGEGQLASIRSISPSFFQTFDISLLAGRTFNATDSERQVIVVSQKFAERYGLANDTIIGRTFNGFDANGEIVGVVADVRTGKVTSEVAPTVFQPIRSATSATFYVRSAQPPEALINSIRETITQIDPTMPITGPQTVVQHFRESMTMERFLAGTSSVLGVLATMLAALGLYGVLAYSVAQRSREIGLRIALGAEMGRIRLLVFTQVTGMAVIGLILGGIAALPISNAARSLLFGVEVTDPIVYAAAATILSAVIIGAAYIPARRASRVDPMTVLRYE